MKLQTCQRCHGAGEDDNEFPCERCNGDGVLEGYYTGEIVE